MGSNGDSPSPKRFFKRIKKPDFSFEKDDFNDTNTAVLLCTGENAKCFLLLDARGWRRNEDGDESEDDEDDVFFFFKKKNILNKLVI